MKPDLVTIEIKTSEQHGKAFCDERCDHFILFVSFPPQGICKVCGPLAEPDSLNRFPRHLACKYICGEEVPERFWSPMRNG